jgi:predicted GNAT superfamily acetyltransferase
MTVNDSWRSARFDADSPLISIEIPADWTTLQHTDGLQAQAWRTVTDTIFQRYIGLDAGQYVVTGVGTNGERRYLVAERVSDELWRRLGAMNMG